MIQPVELDVKFDTFKSAIQRGKWKASFPDDGGPRPRRLRVIDLLRYMVKEIFNWSTVVLSLTYLSMDVNQSNVVFEAKNVEGGWQDGDCLR